MTESGFGLQSGYHEKRLLTTCVTSASVKKEVFVFSPLIFWPGLAGVIVLAIGCFTVRKDLSAAPGLDKLFALACVFFAAPLALFGAEHFAAARGISQVVPPWMPGRLFWTYFVGLCLIAAALSLVLGKYIRLTATLLAIMFLLFVVLIHLPNVAAHPENRFVWAVAARDLTFAAGACALAESLRTRGSPFLTPVRLYVALALIFFGVEHFLHPQCAPGVPLEKVTPDWFPLRMLLGYFSGAVIFVGGAAMLFPRYARTAAAGVGLLFTLLTVFLYGPILLSSATVAEMNVGENYVADTLLYGAAVLLLAAALPAPSRPIE
jgi:uncharacterized membrane protein